MFQEQVANNVAEQEQQGLSVKVDLRTEASNLPDKPCSAEENYLKRKAEVTRQDYEEFLQYRRGEAQQNEGRQRPPFVEVGVRKPLSVHRRRFLPLRSRTAPRGGARGP